jgi:uncharacterized RDD family membrane protein YckC
MSQSTDTIHAGDRFVMLIAELVINKLFLNLPFFLVLSLLFYLDMITFHAFMKCSIFLSLVTYLNKDIAGGRSIGKRFLGYAVVNESDGRPPRMAVCFLRNVTGVIFPIELIYGLFSPAKKISDYFTKTKIVRAPAQEKYLISFYNDIKDISYNDETRETLGLTLLLFLLVLFIK